MQDFIRDYSLPRDNETPLEFRGELIVSQELIMEGDICLDDNGQVQSIKHKDIMTFSLYRTEDDRFVYHATQNTIPPVKTARATGRFETLKQHRKTLKGMERTRQCGAFKLGPLRFATS